MLTTLASILGPLGLLVAPPAAGGDLLAIRVGKAETIAQGTLEHVVILVEDGKIVQVGEDLPIERGIPVLDRPEWTAMPGWVNCHTRAGLDGPGGRGFEPQTRASKELYPDQSVYEKLIELGVTTLGLHAAGGGVPGQAVAVRTLGEQPSEVILQDPAYLEIELLTSASSKKMLRGAFEKLDEYDEKVEKARAKWEKDQEKKKKKKKSSKSKSKKDDDDEKKDEDKDEDAKADEEEKDAKKDDKKKDDESDEFVAPEPDPKVQPFLDLREGRLSALIDIQKASDYLHLLDVIEEREFDWSLRCPLRDDVDLYEVADKVGERELRIVLGSRVTLQPFTRRERNLPAELHRAGARLVLVPRSDRVEWHERWREDVGGLVAAGLDREAALAAVTLEAAHVLGLEESLGSLEAGKSANIVFFDGDPLEPGSRVQAVMLDGEFVVEEAGQ